MKNIITKHSFIPKLFIINTLSNAFLIEAYTMLYLIIIAVPRDTLTRVVYSNYIHKIKEFVQAKMSLNSREFLIRKERGRG